MKILTCVAACLFSIAGFGQTKLISHRSHSGSDANFRTAIENNLFDIGNSNFGIVNIYVEKIDTVIMKENNKIIVLIKRSPSIQASNYKTSFVRDTLTKASAPAFFTANSIDELKTEIHKMFNASVLDSTTRFIGFSKKFMQKAKPTQK